MSDDVETFDAVGEDTLEVTVSDGTTYEFPEFHVPQLKAMFDGLEIEGAEVPEFDRIAENSLLVEVPTT